MEIMYSQYKNLASQKGSQTQMRNFVEEADTEELCKMVLKVLGSSEVLRMLDDILQVFAGLEDGRNQEKRQKLVKAVFDALRTAKVTSKHADNIVGRIVADFSIFERTHLVKLVDYFVERIRANDDEFMSWKDVLPLLLERLEEEKSINYRGSDVTGKEYKISIIRSICDIDWNTAILTSLAKMFVELTADLNNKSVCEMIMRALTSKLMSVDINELPPLVHQMLKLGSENNSTLLFASLARYFNLNYDAASDDTNSQEESESIVSDKVPLKELQQTESTVLYYIYQSALDNAKGPSEYMRCLKQVVNAPEFILDTFVMSVLLLLSNLYEEQSSQILKAAFLRHIQEQEYENHSAWLRRVASENSPVMDVINQVIDNSNKDRQLVLKGMVDFAFMLLSIERKAGVDVHLPWEYGLKILQKIARKRNDAGGTILETLVDKIFRAGTNVIQYTDCLAYMCRKLTMTVLEHQVWITTLMEHLLVIPGTAAAHVLQAILPLMRISGSIRDSLIMILRKALYRKGTETRRMAVLGFLQLLKNLKLTSLTALSQSESMSSSQVASSSSFFTQATLERPSQRAASNPWHNTTLCREILSILSKCFTHEIEVRSHLYLELYYGIVKNEELTEYVVGMLLEHFNKYYEKDEEVIPPIILDKCCTIQGIEVVLQEPLADLIFVLQKIYLRVASKDSAHIDKLAVVLESLCMRMAQTDLEHMGLVDDTDLLDGMPKSQQKQLAIKQTISVYEALIAYRICSWSQDSVNVAGNIISLFKGYLRFVEYIRRLGKRKGPGKGKKDKEKDKDDTVAGPARRAGKPPTIKLPNTVMDFDTITKTVVLLHNPDNPYTTKEQVEALRGRYEFHIYVLQTCLQLLQNVKNLKDHELSNCLELNKKNFITVSETLYKFVVQDIQTVMSFNTTVAELGLECFKECCDIMCSLYSKELPSFLEVLSDVETSRGLALQLQGLISPLKDIFLSTFEVEPSDEVKIQKITMLLIDTISKLVQKMMFNEVKAENFFDWLIEVAKTKEDVDAQVTSTIIQLILLIEDRCLEFGEVIQDLCVEFCCVLGKNDKSEVTATRNFLIINENNVHQIYIETNKILTAKLQNLNWLLGRLNAEYTAMTSLEADTESNRQLMKDREQSLCRQFSFILAVFEILASAKINPGQASDIIFKNLQKVYNFACTLTKYFKKKSTSTNPAFQSVKFIPVIQGAGSALKQAITDLILHIESSQSSGKSNDAQIQRNKILREVMVIPGVVQAMDMFDKEIALLAKKTGVDLMKYTKYNTVRDFRISNSQLMENLEKMNVSLVVTQAARPSLQNDDDDEEEENEHDSEDEENPPKRRRS